MKSTAYTCPPPCGKVKGETNHWFGLRHHPKLGALTIVAFSKIPDDQLQDFEHICGSACLLRHVSLLVGDL